MERGFWQKLTAILLTAVVLCITGIMNLAAICQAQESTVFTAEEELESADMIQETDEEWFTAGEAGQPDEEEAEEETQILPETTEELFRSEAVIEETEEEITGFGAGPETDSGQKYVYADESVEVAVTLSPDLEIPADAVLLVRAITDADTAYESLARQAEEAVSGQTEQMLFYDISFYTAGQEYIPVADTATVSIRFKDASASGTEGEVTVLHYEEEAEEPVALAAVEVERDTEDALAALTFQTEGFSVYAVVTVTSEVSKADPAEITDLDGKSYAILSHTGRYAMLPETLDSQKLRYQEGTEDLVGRGMWTFTAKEGGYQISSGGRYLCMGSDGSLTLAEEETASVFSVSLYDGQYILIRANGNYINSYGGESSISGFAGWSGNDAGSQLLLYEVPVNHVANLDGRRFVIVNRTTGVGMTAAETEAEADQTGLAAAAVTFSGADYVSGGGLAEWLFEAGDTAGAYYISTVIGDTKKYLNMKLNTGTQGSLALSDAPQEIWVSAANGGGVLLSIASDGRGYLNSSSSAADHRFWVFDGNGVYSQQSLCGLKAPSDAVLYYDLASDGTTIGGHEVGYDQWILPPSVEEGVQEVTRDGVSLYHVNGADEDGYYSREYTSGILGNVAAAMKEQGKSCGKQFCFEGWLAQTDGTTCLFAEGAAASLKEDGIHIVDMEGTERILPLGTTLRGTWSEISDLAAFYVNYTGTILDTEGDVQGRNTGQFTGVIGVGHVYYGTQQVGSDQTFGNDANKKIRAKFTKEFVKDDPECQIVLDYVTSYENGQTSIYTEAEGINDTELEKYLLDYIRGSGIMIQVSTADNKNNPQIENENATADNYSVRWYVLKEQADGWHIDGVMVAKTAEITVSKTFSGLSEEQVRGILENNGSDSFDIAVQLGVGSDGNPQPYFTMLADKAEGEGQYAYYGQEKTGGQSYTWVLNAINNEKYTLLEENYELEGYDVSTIAVHYYKGEDRSTEISYDYSPETGGMEPGVLGGRTTAVTFNNLYTKKGTGAFSIIKRAESTAENDTGGVLQNAEFILYQSDGITAAETAASNARGTAYFHNLEEGTYILKETKAPKGYAESLSTWTVEVEKGSSQTVRVTVYENDPAGNKKEETAKICYNGGVVQSYPIENTPEAGTVRVTKIFENLTALQMERIVQESCEGTTEGYYIRLKESGAQGEENNRTLYLQDAVRSQDGYRFTWMVKDLEKKEEEGNAKEYQISEHHYLTEDYMDAVVTAEVNGHEKEAVIKRSGDDAGAYIEGILFDADTSDTVEVTNCYINHFTLGLQKKDRKTDSPLPGAEFDIYGAYRESTDTSRSLVYTDPDTGEMKRVYYISTIVSDENGQAVQKGLKLSGEDHTFVYILHEEKAPDGYMTDAEPVILKVRVDSENYHAGTYSVVADNAKYVDVTVEKQVRGNLGDHQKLFHFAAEVTDSEGKRLMGLEAADDAGYSVKEDGTISFALKSKERVSLRLPEGYQLRITEAAEDREGYRCTYFLDGSVCKEDSCTISGNMTVVAENYKDTNVDTGVTMPGQPDKAVLLFAAGMLALLLGKRRHGDET